MEKKLFRSVKDKMIAGVCSGIGEYLGIDPTIVRLVFAALLLFGGGGALAYLLLWIIVPEEPASN